MFNATNQVTTEATYRVTPIHEVPETAKRMEVLNSWSGQAFSVNWSNISEDNSYGKKIEEWVIIVGNTEQLVVNDTPVARFGLHTGRAISSFDMNKDGTLVYSTYRTYSDGGLTMTRDIHTKSIYGIDHKIIEHIEPINHIERGENYPQLEQWPYLTESSQVITLWTKEWDNWTHLYIDHQKIPLDLHKEVYPLKIDWEKLYISFKTAGGLDKILMIELDNHRARPKQRDHLNGYRWLTQRQLHKIIDLTDKTTSN